MVIYVYIIQVVQKSSVYKVHVFPVFQTEIEVIVKLFNLKIKAAPQIQTILCLK